MTDNFKKPSNIPLKKGDELPQEVKDFNDQQIKKWEKRIEKWAETHKTTPPILQDETGRVMWLDRKQRRQYMKFLRKQTKKNRR